MNVSRFAPSTFPAMNFVAGVTSSTTSCNLKSGGQRDLLVMCMPAGSTVGGVFTQSTVTSTAVQRGRSSLREGRARALVVHSGNANALTGSQGRELVERICERVAGRLDCSSSEVFMAGTGIIGQRISDEQILRPLPELVDKQDDVRWTEAAEAIMTTDTFAKASSRTVILGGRDVVVSGIAKGSGMIAPDMATMLCFMFTDATLDAVELQQMVTYANARSFNLISVDGDESTSDTMLAFATQVIELPSNDARADALLTLREAFLEVAWDLAMQIVGDGEGISKLIEVTVCGARTHADAQAMARSVAESPLVKTAVAGGHANWGRVVMALGKTHRPVAQDRLQVWLGEHHVAKDGDQNPEVSRDALERYMKSDKISITADVGTGHESSTIWTCDLTSRYIDINAHYVT